MILHPNINFTLQCSAFYIEEYAKRESVDILSIIEHPEYWPAPDLDLDFTYHAGFVLGAAMALGVEVKELLGYLGVK